MAEPTLSRPVGGRPMVWDAALIAELDYYALADVPLSHILLHFNLDGRTLARGAMLRVRQLLEERQR